MIDLEQAIRDEFAREAAEAPDAEATQRYALSLVAEPVARRIRRWVLPAVAALLLAVPVGTVVAIRAGTQHSVTASSDPSELYDTSWTLSRYVVLDPATGEIVSDTASATGAPTLRFSGQTGYRFTGCSAVTGSVDISSGTLRFATARSTLDGCKTFDPRVTAQVRAMSTLGPRPLSWRVDNHELTISAGGQQLTFIPSTGR